MNIIEYRRVHRRVSSHVRAWLACNKIFNARRVISMRMPRP